ncbi:methyltransferase, FkbM family [Ostertagia ostertagi]
MCWLEDNVGATYDLVIEIGANAGLYTVFLDALMKDAPALPEGRERRIVAFEPSAEAYRRLLANLAANGTRHVAAFQAAVGEHSGLQPFFEPRQHLTNGSLLREFSENFTDRIDETIAVVVAAPELARWLSPAGRALIKIDAEGFEPTLLSAMAPLLDRHHPDLLIEVLPFTLDALNGIPALADYDKYLLLPEGPEKTSLEAAVKSAGCTGGKMEFDDDKSPPHPSGKFEVDDAMCGNQKHDLVFDHTFKLISKKAD